MLLRLDKLAALKKAVVRWIGKFEVIRDVWTAIFFLTMQIAIIPGAIPIEAVPISYFYIYSIFV